MANAPGVPEEPIPVGGSACVRWVYTKWVEDKDLFPANTVKYRVEGIKLLA